jgi:isochorismate synthase EntC
VGQVVSTTQTLSGWPVETLPADDDWVYWQRPRQGLRMLGLGSVYAVVGAGRMRFASLQVALSELVGSWQVSPAEPAPAIFTGFAFAARGHALWPNARLWVPAVLLREEAGVCTVRFSALAGRVGEMASRWRAIWQAIETPRRIVPVATYRDVRHANGTHAFIARGHAASQAIVRGDYEELVLTRTLRLRSDAPAQTEAVLAALAEQNAECAIFGASHMGQALVGASPETLLEARGDRIEVDARARAALSGICTNPEAAVAASEPRLDVFGHPYRRIRAKRRPDVSLFDLVARLHPSSAVGGAPTAAALDWLRRHGDRRASWYTGGIGWIDGSDNCDIAVPLRCGVLRGQDAHLFADAGFVAGSDPQQKFAETESGFAVMRAALDACARQG